MEMYEYKKRESKLKKIISLIFLIIVVAASSVFIYSMYTDIDVYSTDENNNVAVRLSQNESKKEACIQARVIKISSGKYRLKVWNSGNADAFDISVHFEEGTNIMIGDQEKIPFDVLEENKSFELWLIVHSGSARKFRIVTEWRDTEGNTHSKSQMGDI